MAVIFACQSCGFETPKWMGRCPSCLAWNSFAEEKVDKKSRRSAAGPVEAPVKLNEFSDNDRERIVTGNGEFDRVLGGGIVPGSLVLISGDPGIGKSTLLLQISDILGKTAGKVLYVSGEESPAQVKSRARRLGLALENIYFFPETDIYKIEDSIKNLSPAVVVVDSIQTVYNPDMPSIAGSLGQIRESTVRLQQIAKKDNIPVFLVGHITKDGAIAGPKVLEHIVDTVLYFENMDSNIYRLLRTVKNRFGSTNEIGIFLMDAEGLTEVKNPSGIFLDSYNKNVSGTSVACCMEGTRPVLIEVQALCVSSGANFPRRTAVGVDPGRVAIIIAVLEKRAGILLSSEDIYVNVAGGLKITEPSLDLAIAASLISSYRNSQAPADTVFIGEIGLGGEIRQVDRIDVRLKEIEKLGFKRCVLPAGISDKTIGKCSLEIIKAATIRDLTTAVF